MKKLALITILCLVSLSLYATSPTDSTMVGLTIEDVDVINVKVFESDERGAPGTETDVIDLKHNDATSQWYANYWLRIQVTTTHKIKISLGTDGPLAYDRADPTADTIDININQIYVYWETTSVPLPISQLWISNNGDYSDKDYYEIGTDGILTVNDASMGWGFITVPDSYLTGKKIANYSTNIVVKATVI